MYVVLNQFLHIYMWLCWGIYGMPSAWLRYVVAWVLTCGTWGGGGGLLIYASYYLIYINFVSRSYICCSYCCYTIGLLDAVMSITLLL